MEILANEMLEKQNTKRWGLSYKVHFEAALA